MSTDASPKFVYWQPGSWRDAVKLAEEMPGWMFRGQANRKWKLETGLERTAKTFEFPLDAVHEAEEQILNQFKRQAHQYLPHVPDDDQPLEWLAVLQHHGGPTRLLDCTASFYVASFFAVDDATDGAAIWCINRHLLDSQLIEVADLNTDADHEPTIEKVARRIADQAITTSMGPLTEGVEDECDPNPYFDKPNMVAVRPWRLNERMTIQQGWLLCPTRLAATFQHNLNSALGIRGQKLPGRRRVNDWKQLKKELDLGEIACVKIIIPREMHLAVVRDLRQMNISAATLFPGLDGFARSLRFPLRIFDGLAGPEE